jgi:3-dehydroquinate synthase
VRTLNLTHVKKLDICASAHLSDGPSRSYPIYIGEDLNFSEIFSACLDTDASDILIITNEILAGLYLDKLHSAFDLSHISKKVVSCVLPDGEHTKSLESFGQIMEVLLKEHFHRDVVLIALGGGVIGDLTGFVAATFMRGIRFIQIPTSLLAQVDASIGGKTAINHPLGKNMIGAFYPPKAVLIDVRMLATLPDKQFKSGLAEVVKHALILDENFADFLVENREKILAKEKTALSEMIFRSCKIKAEIVQKDEREEGLRAILNFGHTLGHAIETSMNYQILHGEAVSIGMLFALKLSCLWTNFPEEKLHKALGLWRAFDLPEKLKDLSSLCALNAILPGNCFKEKLLAAMKLDKKHAGNELKYILLEDIGQPVIYGVNAEKMQILSGLLEEFINE